MAEVWFSSDWHSGHANRVRGVSQWDDKSACRDFDTLEEHDAKLVENINKCAKEGDTIYMLGDVALGGRISIYNIMSKLTCKNVHLCLGNHDHHIRKNAIITVDDKEIRAQDLFLSVQDRITKKICGEKFVLDHYAMRTWENGHRGSIMLYGHSHGTLPDYEIVLPVVVNERNGTPVKAFERLVKFKSMDVGIDTHPEFRPYHIDEIRQNMSDRIPLRVDRHIE